MPFKPNYRQQRSERDRVARLRKAEKQKKLDEKTAQRKAQREGTQASAEPTEGNPGRPEGDQ